MKQLLIFFLFFSFSLHAQQFSNVDSKVRKYPKYNSPEKLAAKINIDFNDETEKVRAIYIWLTSNIRYNLSEYYNPTNKRVSFQYSSEEERLFKVQEIKNKINLSHYPEESKWRVLFNYSTIIDFFNQPVYKTKFLASKTELLSPTTGKIKAENQNFVILKIKDLPDNKTILYTYGNNTTGNQPEITKKGNIKTLRIKKPRSNQFLNIFIDLQLALEFKVLVK
jgi:hypothetical protein